MSTHKVSAKGPASGRLQAVPSKSATHRAVLLALCSGEATIIESPLIADDTRALFGAVRRAGCSVEISGSEVTVGAAAPVAGPASGSPPIEIDCGAAGTLLRLLTGVLSARRGRWILAGTPRLQERPLGPLIEALRSLGARIRCLRLEGYAPLEIDGGVLSGGRVVIDAGDSSQFLSALILAGVCADGEVEVDVERLTSAPYVEITRDWVTRFGGRTEVDGHRYRVLPGLRSPGRVRVEGDWSSAAYPFAAAALTGGEVEISGLRPESAQGDRRFVDLLEQMGAAVHRETSLVRVRGDDLRALDVDMAAMPDQVPTLASLAPWAEGVTRIRGAGHLRLKESDRLAAMAEELRRVGAGARETPDGLEIAGVWAQAEPPGEPVVVRAHDDHRIAMSMALLGLRRPGLAIDEPEVVTKSYPGFWEDLERIVGS